MKHYSVSQYLGIAGNRQKAVFVGMVGPERSVDQVGDQAGCRLMIFGGSEQPRLAQLAREFRWFLPAGGIGHQAMDRAADEID